MTKIEIIVTTTIVITLLLAAHFMLKIYQNNLDLEAQITEILELRATTQNLARQAAFGNND